MARYVALIDGEAGAYGVAFPDCPDCTAMGRTVEDVLMSATEALREWTSDRVKAGLDIPRNRPAEEVRNDPDLDGDFRGGAMIASVPLLLDSGRFVRTNLAFDEHLLAAIDEAARLRGLTRSAFLASAAREKIAADG